MPLSSLFLLDLNFLLQLFFHPLLSGAHCAQPLQSLLVLDCSAHLSLFSLHSLNLLNPFFFLPPPADHLLNLPLPRLLHRSPPLLSLLSALSPLLRFLGSFPRNLGQALFTFLICGFHLCDHVHPGILCLQRVDEGDFFQFLFFLMSFLPDVLNVLNAVFLSSFQLGVDDVLAFIHKLVTLLHCLLYPCVQHSQLRGLLLSESESPRSCPCLFLLVM